MKRLANIHPGQILSEEFLTPLKITAYRLAKETGISQTRISQILLYKRSVSADTAIRLSKFFGTTPQFWLGLQNDDTQRTDVAYLFPEADSKKIIEELPLKKEFLEIRYIKGAIIWNIKRENVNKSQLAKLISHKLYQTMTIRNVNTARFLAGEKE